MVLLTFAVAFTVAGGLALWLTGSPSRALMTGGIGGFAAAFVVNAAIVIDRRNNSRR